MKKLIDSLYWRILTIPCRHIADSSTLTYFNQADSLFCFDPKKDPYFEPIFIKSKEIYEKTNGAFDPSIAPLVNYYGFGYVKKKDVRKKIDTVEVRRLLSLMVFDTLQLTKDEIGNICIQKPNKNVMLDFNSLSPGYAVDVIADFFNKKGFRNYMINLGGEITALGVNDKKGRQMGLRY